MSFQNKRGALEQITKDDFERDDEYSRDEEVEVARTADAATMQKRKVLPMPKRRAGAGNGGNGAGNGSAAAKPASNGFAGLTGFAGSGGSTGSTGSGPFSGLSGLAGSSSVAAASSSPSSSNESDVTLKRIAMNEKFVDTVSSKVRDNAAVDLSDVVTKYLEYAKQVDPKSAPNTTTTTTNTGNVAPAATPSATPKSLFSFGAAKNFSASPAPSTASTTDKDSTSTASFGFGAKASESKPAGFGASNDTKSDTTPAASPAFSFGSKPEAKAETKPESSTTAPKPFTFGSTAPSGPSFSFSKSGADVAKEKAEGGAPSFSFTGKKAEAKPEEKPVKKMAPVEIDSDSDSDDEIDITKGPSFTLAAPPTTTNSAFTFNNKPQSESSTKTTGPSFTFDKKVSTGGFSFKPEEKEEKKEVVQEETKEVVKDDKDKKDFTWKPSQGVVFGSNSEKKTDDESESKNKPAFSFGASSAAKPFTFGSKPAESSESATKPVFGGSAFGAKPSESAESGSKPAFSFGAKPAESADSGSKPAFSFGKPAESSSSTPAFGVSSGNLFNAKTDKTDKPDTKASADAGEPDDAPKTVTDSDDLSGQGPGEENEDNVAEYRVKLYKLDEGKWDVCGVGQLRVLVDKDTKKARLLMRAEQSGRVLLNCVVRKELTYSTTKSNVNIVDFDADSKPVKYMARIKTVPEAEQLSAKIEEVK